MARDMNRDASEVFRAVLVRGDYTFYEGPYATRGAARARVTFWENRWGTEAGYTGHVESSQVTWTRVDTTPQDVQE
jgi:hypothetical protein